MLIKPPMPFTLTDPERQAVLAMKEACDEQGIEYKHNFELAKYVLVAHSAAEDSNPKAPQIRLNTALNRLKKRNKWIKKHGLDSIDPYAALLEVAQESPDYFVSRYTTDKEGRVVVAHHHAYAPAVDTKTKRAKYYAAELFRMDLGAADLDEARRGIAMVILSEDQLTLKRAFNYLKFVCKAQENLKDMHPNRIKKVYSEVPAFLTHLIGPAKQLLPRKIAERITVVGSILELHNHIDLADCSEISVKNWATGRLERYKETLEKLSL